MYLALCKLFMSANCPHRTSSMSKVSLANSSISAAVPTNMRSSWDNWSRVISTPMGRSHLPTTSSSRKVWWRASVHTVSQIVESWFTKTLACVEDNNNTKLTSGDWRSRYIQRLYSHLWACSCSPSRCIRANYFYVAVIIWKRHISTNLG